MSVSLVVAHHVLATEAEGPGRRFAVWVSGCSIRCPGCCNPGMFERDAGREMAIEALVADYESVTVEGITFVGGEPFEQASGCAALAREVARRGGTVMVFTGYTRERLERRRDEQGVGELLDATDLLVDGPFVREAPEGGRRWIGSSNQRMHFLTARYRSDDPRFRASNHVVMRLDRRALEVHGWPGVPVLGGDEGLPADGAPRR